ncbi:hypothetical protein F2P81_025524, partial [Scomber scombrus]
PRAQYTTSVRSNMQNQGLYEKFPAEAAMLTGFKQFLIDTLEVPHCQQEVDNVSRMLRFIQPNGDEVNLDFLVKSTETQDFLNKLKGAKMGPATILNYIKNMIQFVEYLKTHLNFASADPDFHRKCQSYMDLLKSLRKPVAKANSKVTCKTRYDRFVQGQRSLHDCQRLLRVAKKTCWVFTGSSLKSSVWLQTRRHCFPVLLRSHPDPETLPKTGSSGRNDTKCSRWAPTIQRVAKYISEEGWTANHPRPQDIVSKWRPANKTQVESDPGIMRMVRRQKWSGLAIMDFGGNKGHGVVATKHFEVGSIVCDYHGKLITKAEGNKMMESTEGEKGFLFFFNDLCIDAQTFPCECHPSQDTAGRKMNHSKKRFNVKPLHCKMKFPEGERDIILFQATKDIAINDELLFDHGVRRKSFHSEAMALLWLDS